MKTKNLLINSIWFFLGSAVSDVLFHLRFNNSYLREEMIILMRDGNNGYFLIWAFPPLIGVAIICGLLYHYKLKTKRETNQNEKPKK